MMKIQEAADVGKIVRMIKSIIGGSQDFSLEVLYNKDGTKRTVTRLLLWSTVCSARIGSSRRRRNESEG